jgi:hypothetical protein
MRKGVILCHSLDGAEIYEVLSITAGFFGASP